jgi:hypothetical protein
MPMCTLEYGRGEQQPAREYTVGGGTEGGDAALEKITPAPKSPDIQIPWASAQ